MNNSLDSKFGLDIKLQKEFWGWHKLKEVLQHTTLVELIVALIVMIVTTQKLIHNIVSQIDNLTRNHVRLFHICSQDQQWLDWFMSS